MRTPPIALLILLMAGVASAQQQGSTSYTPARTTDAPAFMNAEVVRVDRTTNRITFRSESRETTLSVEGDALTAIGSLHAGDKVVVGYRVAQDAGGREVRYVTSVTEASPTSGDPRRVTMAAGSTVRARVLTYDRGRRRVTVVDEGGTLRTIPVRAGVAGLDTLIPGSNVAFNLGGAGGGVNVSGITPLGSTPVFANNVFPPVNGQLVSFNQRTGVVTLDTANAGRVTFPVGTDVAASFGGLRPGQNLSLNFDVTTAAQQAQSGATGQAGNRTTGTTRSVGTAAPLATITGVQSLVAGAPPVQAAGVPGAVSPISPNTASPNAPGLAGVPGATTGGQQVGNQQGGLVQGGNQQGGNQQGTGNVAPNSAAVVPGGIVGGPVAAGTSPLLNPVPNVPTPTAIAAAVLPPAVAKQPLSQEEVGLMRAQGEADLDNAAVALAAAATGIDVAWAGYKAQCMGGFTAETSNSGREWYLLAQGRVQTPTDDACRALYTDLTGRAQGFIRQLDTVEDAARKADVLPVRVREVFERHRLR
jgi:hypothetical protein